jgi:ABC-2 type transport system ATP-binding protein
MPQPTLAIAAQELHKSFGGRRVLHDLTLEVATGEVFGLIGPSGSGKSTAILLFCGRVEPDRGTAVVLGEEPTRFRAATRRRIGYMPQHFLLYPDLTIEQNVGFAAGLYGLAEWRHRERIRAILELVELWEARKQAARDVSGGMLRRLVLAAALVPDPDLLFADEPTANLDPILRAKLWDYFRELCQRGRTMLITTQYIDEAEYCDRVGLMFEGALIAVGRPDALRRQAFGGDVIDIVIEQPSPHYTEAVAKIMGVLGAEVPPGEPLRVIVEDAYQAIPLLVDALEEAGATVRSVVPYRPTFDEVFIRLIEQHSGVRLPVGHLRTNAAGTT